jgi:hypothetical protein
MSKKRGATDRAWPPELKGPFPMRQLKDQAREKYDVDGILTVGDDSPDALTQSYAKELIEREARRRLELLAKFFGRPWPQSEVDWVRFVFLVCRYFEVPGFRMQGKSAGAPKKWGRKNHMLFADVMSVVAKMSRPSEVEAVRRIARDPERFLNRYSSVKNSKTLHRQFLRAKNEFNEFEELDRIYLMSRDEMIEHLIDSYSAEAEVKRRGRVAQKSVKPKNA